jgi:hypothetical protein
MIAEGTRRRSGEQIETVKRGLDDLRAMVERGEHCDLALAHLAEVEIGMTRLAHLLAGAYSTEYQIRLSHEDIREELARTFRLLDRR